MINPSSDPVEPQEQSHRQQLGVFGAHLLKKDLKKRSEALGGGATFPPPSAHLAPGIGAEGSLWLLFIPAPLPPLGFVSSRGCFYGIIRRFCIFCFPGMFSVKCYLELFQ